MGSPGALAKMALDPSTFDTSSYPIEFESESLQRVTTHADTGGIRGTRSHASERVKEASSIVQGTIVLQPSPADLDILLPWILGAAESNDTFALAEALTPLNVLIDKVDDVYLYSDVYVNRAVFSSEESSPLRLTLDLIGKTEADSQSFPALTLGVAANNKPYMHHELTLSLAGSSRQCKRLEITIDNMLATAFNNSLTPSEIKAQDRIITVRATLPASEGLHAQAVAGIAGSATYAMPNLSTVFTFGKLQIPDRTPVVAGKSEIVHELEMVARMNGATKELVVTNDSNASS